MTSLEPAFCFRCNSQFCGCAMQLNENMRRMEEMRRVEHGHAMMITRSTLSPWPSGASTVTPVEATCHPINYVPTIEPPFHKEYPNKKLLLLL